MQLQLLPEAAQANPCHPSRCAERGLRARQGAGPCLQRDPCPQQDREGQTSQHETTQAVTGRVEGGSGKRKVTAYKNVGRLLGS